MNHNNKPEGVAAYPTTGKHHQAKSTAIATPSIGVRVYNDNPIVTAEKSTFARNNNSGTCGGVNYSTVTCPDGSVLTLSPDKRHGSPSNIILGRGQYGIPSSASHVSRQACVLRLVKNNNDDKAFTTELVVLGSQPCRVTRGGNAFIVKSIAQIVADGNDTSSSHMIIRDGDVIEPCYRNCSVEEATSKGTYHPFRVSVSAASVGGTSVVLNPNAKWLYNQCSVAKSTMEYPHSTLHLATKILTAIRQHYSSNNESDANAHVQTQPIQDLLFKMIDEGKKRDLTFVFNVASKSYELCKDHEGLTEETLRDVAVACGDVDVDNDGLTPHRDVMGPSNHKNTVAVSYGKSEHTVMDASAFLEASRKIDEAAKYSSSVASNDKVVGSVQFHDESFLETFLEDPTTTTHFFITYYKSLVKNGANKDIINNLLNTFVGAMSPLESNKRRMPTNMERFDDFPLKELLSLLVDRNQMVFGKRVIDGYIWLSCRTLSSGPKLLLSACDPLVILCNALGWNELEDLLVTSVEKLCERGDVIMAVEFCQTVVSKSSTLAGGGNDHRSRVCARMAKVAYGKRFHTNPKDGTDAFIKYYKYNELVHRKFVQNASSKESCRILIGSFVDVMSPPDPENRRVPLIGVKDFPLKELLSLLVEGRNYALGKRMIEGYIWLSSQEVRETNTWNGRVRIVQPRGPTLLVNAEAPLLSLCDALGWNLLEGVLIDAVKKLCTYGSSQDAFTLCRFASTSSGTSGGDGHRSRVYLMMRKAAYATIIASFHNDPTLTANHVILFASKSTETDLKWELINDFVNMMSPTDVTRRRMPLKTPLYDFPLKEILSLLVEGEYFALGKRVIEGYIWLSSQEVRETNTWNGRVEIVTPRGPSLLLKAAAPLVSICNALGWNELEDILVESVDKIFQFAKSDYYYMERAIDLIEKIHPTTRQDNDCSRVCAKMATIACDGLFNGLHAKQGSYPVPTYSKFIRLIADFCPTMAPRFETFAKNLDVEQMLYPLLSNENFRSSASTSDAGKNTLSYLTNHCAQLLHSRVSSDPNIVTAWTVPNAHVCQNASFRGFLENQCKQTFDWQVRKSDHIGFYQELQAFVSSGDITCESHQPWSRAYHFKITKLKTCRVHLNVLSCSCSSSTCERNVTQVPSDCLRDSSKVKRAREEEMLLALKAYLTPEEILGLASQKRKAVDALGDDDDDVVLTGVADVAETVAKRVKAAEDAGEVIEIL
jgi:hypothetical protein